MAAAVADPAGALQAVFLSDEADACPPANCRPATTGPMEGLLRRARSAGVGVFLATQSPGDLDDKCRDQVTTWLVGAVKEPVAIGKSEPLFEAGRVDPADKLPGQAVGQFYLIPEATARPVLVERNLLLASQLSEDRLGMSARVAGARR